MSEAPRAVVYVDRNALWQNDQDGGDRPAILIEHPTGQQERVHELDVAGGVKLVQNGKGPAAAQNRPHVWLEVFGPYRTARRGPGGQP